ncbi:heavy-metal-associated domain-containing protein [Cytophaga aurantiaca]|uniref:heavy-metal-associated domain-containing protein n=1 Tax=Cytophaga aurantiaca TaxID=29530 RepID=UPI0003787A67|nr:heavy-metal-associated domain-containing protein [Cytophaga aurantiaca]
MKTKKGILSIVFALVVSLFALQVSAAIQDETSTFKVYGNCDMCKKRIETALLKNPNVKKATWDTKSKMLTVVYDPKMISLDAIHKIVADAGHDTDKVKATDASYKSLMGCCQYQRKS